MASAMHAGIGDDAVRLQQTLNLAFDDGIARAYGRFEPLALERGNVCDRRCIC